MKNGWMVRAGRSGVLFDEFVQNKVVAIGWNGLGDLNQYKGRAALEKAYRARNPDQKPSKIANAIAMVYKFANEISKGDIVISYSPERRDYLIAEDQGDYFFKDGFISDYSQLRKVKILGFVPRDSLDQKTKNSLGSTLTLFSLKEDVVANLLAVLEGKVPVREETDEIVEDEEDSIREDIAEQSIELIKDKINKLDFEEMEQLVAHILRAMGFKAKVSPKGTDRNVDVFASPDGLGLLTPRIKAEVKHRNGSMGAKEIRSFIGALREGDNGLFISTGGFSKDARYEAERANVPVTLINIDDLAHLIVENYENFTTDARTMIPLVKIYWPA